MAAQRNISSSSHTLNYIFQLGRQPFLISLPTHKLFGLREKAAQSNLFSEFTSSLCLISSANCSTSSVSCRPRLYTGSERRWSCRPCWIYNHIWYWLFSINSDIPQLTCCLRARQRKWSSQRKRNGERGGCYIKWNEMGVMVEYATQNTPAESLREMLTTWCCWLVTFMIGMKCNFKVGGLFVLEHCISGGQLLAWSKITNTNSVIENVFLHLCSINNSLLQCLRWRQ